MRQSSPSPVKNRAIVIQRGHELAEFANVLDDLAVPVEVLNGAIPTPPEIAGAGLVIVTGSRLIESGNPNLSLWPRTFAVVDNKSKTLASHLNRLGVAMIIRRPIHPRTLRLLLLHEIYRGPERRSRKRISIGHPIRTTGRLFKHAATLLELSTTGARIEMKNPPKVGSKISLLLGKEVTRAKPVKLQAKVMRCIRMPGTRGRAEAEIGVAFLRAKNDAKAILGILDRFAVGPASWNGKPISPQDTQSHLDPAPKQPEEVVSTAADPADSARLLPPSHEPKAAVATQALEKPHPRVDDRNEVLRPPHAGEVDAARMDPATDSREAADANEDSDRRSETRIPYDRRVVALGEEAAKVLLGRDLSVGGMRIAATDAIGVGDVLRVALHCGSEIGPLVVLATALRSDDDDGTCLSFNGLSDGQRAHLEKIIANSSPIHSITEEIPCDPNEQEPGSIVLGEMIETVERGCDSQAYEDDAIDCRIDSIFDANESI